MTKFSDLPIEIRFRIFTEARKSAFRGKILQCEKSLKLPQMTLRNNVDGIFYSWNSRNRRYWVECGLKCNCLYTTYPAYDIDENIPVRFVQYIHIKPIRGTENGQTSD